MRTAYLSPALKVKGYKLRTACLSPAYLKKSHGKRTHLANSYLFGRCEGESCYRRSHSFHGPDGGG